MNGDFSILKEPGSNLNKQGDYYAILHRRDPSIFYINNNNNRDSIQYPVRKRYYDDTILLVYAMLFHCNTVDSLRLPNSEGLLREMLPI